MIALINAGGSGTRLWPLSTPEYPKHLLSLPNAGNGTLLQSSFDRVKGYVDDIFIITESSHADHVKDQLKELDSDHIIIEPARRGTASCLLLALDYIGQRYDEEVPLIMMHADHVIHDVESFRDSIQHASETSARFKAITLLGVEPNHPATGFGYIEKGERVSSEDEKEVHKVMSFKEKPDRKTAEQYLKEGHYLWNMGYFAAPISVFVETMKRDAPDMHKNYHSIKNAPDKHIAYLGLNNVAIDYALMESAKNLVVVPGNFDWVDVGNFQDLYGISSHDDEGNSVQGQNIETEEVTNSFIRNDTEQKIAVIGLDNIAVVMTDHGLVISNRNHAQKVGDVSKRFNGGK